MKMTLPKTTVVSNKEIEIEYYNETLAEAKKYFFTQNKYFVLPYIPNQKDIAGKTVYLPRMPFKYKKINLNEYEKYIETNFKSFWNDFSLIAGSDKLNGVNEIEFRILNIGSGGNAYTEKSGKIIVILRKDMPVNLLFSSLLIELLNIIGFEESFSWEEQQAIRSWLQTSSSLKKYFEKPFIPMLANLRKNNQQGKYQKETERYLEELGINLNINEKDNGFEINNIELRLSPKEFKLFNLLYTNKGKVLTYTEIFDNVWRRDTDEFSLYSITKLVERLRKKLKTAGVDNGIIKLYKGKGYYI